MKCSCGAQMVKPFGNMDAKVAVMSDYPAFDDVKNGLAFTGDGGMALRNELGKAGIQPESLAMYMLYPHNMRNRDCVEDWETYAIQMLLGKKLVLLLGKAVPVFTPYTAEKITGITTTSPLLKRTTIVCGPSLSTIMSSPIGEMRMACEVFADERRKIKC